MMLGGPLTRLVGVGWFRHPGAREARVGSRLLVAVCTRGFSV